MEWRFRVRGLGFGVWGSGFRVRGLGFGDQGLGLLRFEAYGLEETGREVVTWLAGLLRRRTATLLQDAIMEDV